MQDFDKETNQKLVSKGVFGLATGLRSSNSRFHEEKHCRILIWEWLSLKNYFKNLDEKKIENHHLIGFAQNFV